MTPSERDPLTSVTFRMPRSLVKRVEAFRGDQMGGGTLTLSQALRILVEMSLVEVERHRRSRPRGHGDV
jgi:hypothetical protein